MNPEINDNERPSAEERSRLIGMINGFWQTQMIYVATQLRIADRLQSDGPQPVAELAKDARVDEEALYRLLRALASLGVFTETEPRTFALTPIASLLRSNVPGTLHGLALYSGDPEQYRYSSWGQLYDCVTTGAPTFSKLTGLAPFAYLEKHPDKAQVFDEAMESYTLECVEKILSFYDFSQFADIVDVGGGKGHLLAAILDHHREGRGVLYDLPHIIDRARVTLKAKRLGDRVKCVGGDFFSAIDARGDLFILKCILHDWDDEKAVEILKSCRSAMRDDDKLLLMESIVQPGDVPCAGKLMDLNMMVVHGGRERTEEEYIRLLVAAGFEHTRTVLTGSSVDLVEAVVRRDVARKGEGSEN